MSYHYSLSKKVCIVWRQWTSARGHADAAWQRCHRRDATSAASPASPALPAWQHASLLALACRWTRHICNVTCGNSIALFNFAISHSCLFTFSILCCCWLLKYNKSVLECNTNIILLNKIYKTVFNLCASYSCCIRCYLNNCNFENGSHYPHYLCRDEHWNINTLQYSRPII